MHNKIERGCDSLQKSQPLLLCYLLLFARSIKTCLAASSSVLSNSLGSNGIPFLSQAFSNK